MTSIGILIIAICVDVLGFCAQSTVCYMCCEYVDLDVYWHCIHISIQLTNTNRFPLLSMIQNFSMRQLFAIDNNHMCINIKCCLRLFWCIIFGTFPKLLFVDWHISHLQIYYMHNHYIDGGQIMSDAYDCFLSISISNVLRCSTFFISIYAYCVCFFGIICR